MFELEPNFAPTKCILGTFGIRWDQNHNLYICGKKTAQDETQTVEFDLYPRFDVVVCTVSLPALQNDLNGRGVFFASFYNRWEKRSAIGSPSALCDEAADNR